MSKDQESINYFAETDFRNKKIKFGIKAKDRTRHVYVIGKTGMGKSTLLENMAVQDIENGEGMAFIDPHGGTAEKLLDYIPESRLKDVIYFAPFDTDYPISFNIMEDVGADKRHLVANGLMNAFKKIWVDAWSARMEYILNNVLLALLEYPGATILGVNRMLSDKDYRNQVVANVKDASVRAFWEDEFAKYGDRYMQEAGAAIQNKIGQFVSNPLIRNIIGQPKSSFDVRKIIDEKKILIMNLSKGRMGIENSALLGNMLVTKIYLGAMSRADASPAELQKLPNFYFYVDEFQSFANESFADILSEARKYKLNLTIAHQYIEQMPEEVRDAVFGNVGTMIVFRVGSTDAEVFEKEFAPEFVSEDIVNLGYTQIYLRLMIDGMGSKPFSALTLPPIAQPEKSIKDQVIAETRMKYATPKAEVEAQIMKWYEPVAPAQQKERKPKPQGIGNDVARQATNAQNSPQMPLKQAETVLGMSGQSGAETAPKREFTPPKVVAPAPSNIPVLNKADSEMPPKIQGEHPKTLSQVKTQALSRISLSDLSRNKSSGPTKHSMALKDALLAAMKERENKIPDTKEKVIEVPKKEISTAHKEEIKKTEKEIPEQGAPKEVPEEVLRNLLKE